MCMYCEIEKLGSRESNLFDYLPIAGQKVLAVKKGKNFDLAVVKGKGLILHTWLLDKDDPLANYGEKFTKEIALTKSNSNIKLHISKHEKDLIASIRKLFPENLKNQYPRTVRDFMISTALGRITESILKPHDDVDISEARGVILTSIKGFESSEKLLSDYDTLEQEITQLINRIKKSNTEDAFKKNIATLNIYIESFPQAGRLMGNSKKAKRLKEFLAEIIG